MTLENMEIAAAYMLILAAFFGALLLFGLVFELVIFRLPPVRRFIDNLPGFDDDEEVYQEYLEERARKKAEADDMRTIRRELIEDGYWTYRNGGR